MRIEGKTILLTGASSGIGAALAEVLAEYDCTIILLARRYEKLQEIKEKLQTKKASVFIYACDVSSKEQVAAAADKIEKDCGQIEIAILNSGVGHRVDPEEFTSKYAESTFGANTFGIIYWVEQLLPGFIKRKSGMIVGVTSMADNRGYSGSGFYSASKAASTIFLEGLAVELDAFNIKVITVRPGFVKTPMTDKNEFKMPFLMQPEKAAGIILEGIIREKRYIQFPWQTVLLTNLVGLMPARLYEYLARKQYRNLRKQNEN